MHFKNFNGKLQNFPVISEFANLRIMTYNVWFDGHNDTNRFNQIVNIILKSNSNIVCLQECTNKFLKILTSNKKIVEKFPHFGF